MPLVPAVQWARSHDALHWEGRCPAPGKLGGSLLTRSPGARTRWGLGRGAAPHRAAGSEPSEEGRRAAGMPGPDEGAQAGPCPGVPALNTTPESMVWSGRLLPCWAVTPGPPWLHHHTVASAHRGTPAWLHLWCHRHVPACGQREPHSKTRAQRCLCSRPPAPPCSCSAARAWGFLPSLGPGVHWSPGEDRATCSCPHSPGQGWHLLPVP